MNKKTNICTLCGKNIRSEHFKNGFICKKCIDEIRYIPFN